MTRPPRAAALPPDERRAAIIAATIPLLRLHGAKVTTRQIADAAGIAEGTIFRAFPDKESLVEAAIEKAFDAAPDDAALRNIDLSLPLETRLIEAAEILQRRVAGIWQLLSAVGVSKPLSAQRHGPPDMSALAAVFEPDRDSFRRDPIAAAQLFRGLVLAGSHPAMASEPLPPAELVSFLLDGLRVPPTTPTDH